MVVVSRVKSELLVPAGQNHCHRYTTVEPLYKATVHLSWVQATVVDR